MARPNAFMPGAAGPRGPGATLAAAPTVAAGRSPAGLTSPVIVAEGRAAPGPAPAIGVGVAIDIAGMWAPMRARRMIRPRVFSPEAERPAVPPLATRAAAASAAISALSDGEEISDLACATVPPPARCCATCASSCAIRCVPALLSGANRPGANATL